MSRAEWDGFDIRDENLKRVERRTMEWKEIESRTPGFWVRRLPAMAPARDPTSPGVKRTSPINRTCNHGLSNLRHHVIDAFLRRDHFSTSADFFH